jgi:thymidylate synthase ThyX
MPNSTSASIIADSVGPHGIRLTTFQVHYPRWILAEVNTHRMLSRNSPSSRAIPVRKMIENIRADTALPMAWPKNQKGMTSDEELNEYDQAACANIWNLARDTSIGFSERLVDCNLHKQVANRIIEPWMMTTSLITATEWDNFFALRVNKAAQPEFQRLAYLMLKEYVQLTPESLQVGDWHIPFKHRMPEDMPIEQKLKIATARCARISYLTQDGKIDFDDDLKLHDRLMNSGHWSPFEHCACCLDDPNLRSGNFHGWYQYRKQFAKENRKVDLRMLLEQYEAEMGLIPLE